MKNHSRQNSKTQHKTPLTLIAPSHSLSATSLDLSNNSISIMRNLSRLKHLKILNLSHNKISIVEDIFELEHLEQVNMSYNLIEYLPKEMSKMISLKRLDIRNNKILYIHGISSLEGMQLEMLRVEGNRVIKRPKFEETMERILQKPRCSTLNSEIIQHQHIYKQTEDYNNEDMIEKLIGGVIFHQQKQGQTFANSMELLGTFRSISEASVALNQTQQFQAALQIRDKELFDKKGEIIQKCKQIQQYESKIDNMVEQNTLIRQSQNSFLIAADEYIMDVQSAIHEIVNRVKKQTQIIFSSFESYQILHTDTGLKLIIEECEVDWQKLLLSYLNNTEDHDKLSWVMETVKSYLNIFNSLKTDVIVLDQKIGQYIKQFNHLYRVIEFKTAVQDPNSGLLPHTQQSHNQYSKNIIRQLQQQICRKNAIQNELMSQNDRLFQKVNSLKYLNSQQQDEIKQLKQKWIQLIQFKEEGSMLIDQILLKQQNIIGLLGQKLTGDTFQNIILNQAQTIEKLIEQTKTVREKIYSQQLLEKIYYQKCKHGDLHNKQNHSYQNLETNFNIQTGKKPSSYLKRQEDSAESNLLSDRKKITLPEYPISYFSKSFQVIKAKTSQPTTCRNSRDHTQNNTISDERTRRGNPPGWVHNLFQNTVAKKGIIRTTKRDQSQGYKEYMRYYLRNSIVETMIAKLPTHKGLSKYTQEELRMRKFNQISGKRFLSKS